MTSDIYWKYHYASVQMEKMISVQSPNTEQYVESVDLSAFDYIELPVLSEIILEQGADSSV